MIALTLSGAPRVALALQPEPAHVCQCRAHGQAHRCACPVCAARAHDARRRAAKNLPPCHQGAARAALAEEEAHAAREAAGTCIEPHCGTVEKRQCPRGIAHYVIPRPPTLAPPRGVECIAARAVRACEVPAVPDVPPPKRA